MNGSVRKRDANTKNGTKQTSRVVSPMEQREAKPKSITISYLPLSLICKPVLSRLNKSPNRPKNDQCIYAALLISSPSRDRIPAPSQDLLFLLPSSSDGIPPASDMRALMFGVSVPPRIKKITSLSDGIIFNYCNFARYHLLN